MTRTWGSKLLFNCAICGAECPEEGAEAAAAPGASGVSQITVFDATADSLPAADFFADWGFTISTFTVTGGSPIGASKAQAPPQRRVKIRIRGIGLRNRTRKYTPG